MEKNVNCGVSCGVTDCKFNRGGADCTLDRVHIGTACDCDPEHCTCCDSYQKKR